MKNRELKEYLDTFPDGADVSVIIANLKKREYYPITEYHGIIDMGQPVFCLEIGTPKDMDEENLKHTDLSCQMNLFDMLEVMK